MPNEESKLRKAIEELTKLPQKLKEGVINFAEDSAERVRGTFTRRNVVNAIMPKFFGRGVNKLLDIMSERTKKVEPPRSGFTPENPAAEVGDDNELDNDLFEELLDEIEHGFFETNQNLTKILTKLGGEGSSINSTTPLLLGFSNKTEESTAKIIDVNYEVLSVTEKSNETLAELLDINGRVVKTLQAVEKNTRVDELKQREDVIESGKSRASQMLAQKGDAGGRGGANGNGGGISGAIMDGLVNAALGYAGIKVATSRLGGKVLGGVKGAAGSVWQGVKGAAGSVWQGAKNVAGEGASAAFNAWKNVGGAKGVLGAMKGAASRAPGPLKALGLVGAGGAATSAAPSVSSVLPTTTTALEVADDVAKAGGAISTASKVVGAVAPVTKSGFLQGAKNLGSKALGAPLAVGIGAYEAYNVSKDENLSSEKKVVEYSKIGGKTAGALAGAKVGAAMGAFGGPVGVAIGGLIGGISGYFLGEKGGEIAGDLINAVLPSTKETDKGIQSKASESISYTFNEMTFAQNDKEGYSDFKEYRDTKYKEYLGKYKDETIARTLAQKEAVEKFKVEAQKAGAIIQSEVKTAQLESVKSKPSETSTIVSTAPNVSVSNVVKPDIGTIQPGQTKTNNLQALTQQIEQTNAEKQDMKASPTIVPVTINNQSNTTTSQSSESSRIRTPVPLVRNQDGTIQRLLDLNYHPLLA